MPRMEHRESDDLVVAKKDEESIWSQGDQVGQFIIDDLTQDLKTDMIESCYDKIGRFAKAHNSRDLREAVCWRSARTVL